VREEIFKLHEQKPDEWTPQALAHKYNIREQRVHGIVTLMRIRQQSNVPLPSEQSDKKHRRQEGASSGKGSFYTRGNGERYVHEAEGAPRYAVANSEEVECVSSEQIEQEHAQEDRAQIECAQCLIPSSSLCKKCLVNRMGCNAGTSRNG